VGVHRLLRKVVTNLTDPAGAGVCFVTQGPLTAPDASEGTRRYVAKKRAAIELALRDRFDRAVEAGELPLTVSATDLARFYAVVIQGIALQAQHGGTQEQLFGVVDMAMESWPVRSRKRGQLHRPAESNPAAQDQDQEEDESIDAAKRRPAQSNECVRRDHERTDSPGKRPEIDHVTR
jgi:hypothetical protein